MARKRRPRERKQVDEGDAFRSTLGDLLQQAGVVSSSSGKEQAPSDPSINPVDQEKTSVDIDLSACAQPTIRLERKGRRGKVVTLVEGLEAVADDVLEALARGWRQRLGCGATSEPGRIVLQGDQRKRVEPLLLEAGAQLTGT